MNKRTSAIISNILILLFAVIGIYLSLRNGLSILYFYTLDSAIIAAIASLLFIIFLLMKKDITEIPTWVLILKYISVCCLTVTLIIVLVILIPQSIMSNSSYPWYSLLISGFHFYLHVLCPIIALISFMFFENDKRFNRKKILFYPLIATSIYGIIMLIINYMGIYNGPYFFLMVRVQEIYMTIIWLVIIMIINYLVAKFILIQNQKRVPRRNPRRPM